MAPKAHRRVRSDPRGFYHPFRSAQFRFRVCCRLTRPATKRPALPTYTPLAQQLGTEVSKTSALEISHTVPMAEPWEWKCESYR